MIFYKILLFLFLLTFFDVNAQRVMEYLDRGLVAVKTEKNNVFLSWRLLGSDPANIGFNVYRINGDSKPKKINNKIITAATNYIDNNVNDIEKVQYFVSEVINKKEIKTSKKVNVWDKPYLSIPLKTPQGYSPGDASVGDLDGDGEYEIVIHMVGRGRDNGSSGITTEPILQAYKLNGQMLWEINLGKNIREGAHYTQFMVYDLDCDGKAEIACKTADGTIDGQGNVIGNIDSVYVEKRGSQATFRDRFGNIQQHNIEGYILKGPEYLTVFEGLTGKAITTVDYLPPRHPNTLYPTSEQLREIWGDGNGNRVDRFLASIAYLDGKNPSLIMCRGYYTRTVLVAWNFKDAKLSHLWTFDSDDPNKDYRAYRGQGNHNLSVGDVDGDGFDEIIYGSCVIDHNGEGLYSTGFGHGDAMHFSDLDPENPGFEVFNIQERFDDAGMNFREAGTGKVLWKVASVSADEYGSDAGEGPGRGNSFNIDPRYPGNECWVKGAGITGLYSAKGQKISETEPRVCNFAVWWDGDLLRELLDRNVIYKWDWINNKLDTLLYASECNSINGTKATPVLSADIFGDWREEVIWRTRNNKELRIYTTTIPTDYKFYTFMHDPIYRLAIAWQNVAYNQPPHTSFYIGDEMKPQPKANIIFPINK